MRFLEGCLVRVMEGCSVRLARGCLVMVLTLTLHVVLSAVRRGARRAFRSDKLKRVFAS